VPVIETVNLKKYYGKSRGIEDVSLSVEEGEIFGFIGPNGAGKSTTIRTLLNFIFPTSGRASFGFIGPNGAGKSTTIRTLLNFIFPTSGRASVFGLDVVDESRRIRTQVGYLPSEVGYYEDMTVQALLEYSARFYGLDRRSSLNRINELTDTFELDRRKIHSLSMGNKKKIGVVLALLHRPRLLILDEPTGNLDPLMQKQLFEVLQEENERGTTIFFSSHVLSEVQRFCHRVAIIKEGRILEVEEIEKLRRGLVQKVRIVFKDEIAAGLELPGIIHQARNGRTIDMLYEGDINELVRLMAGRELENLWLEEPPLEEVFLHYYEKEGDEG